MSKSKSATNKIGYRAVFTQKEFVKMIIADLVNRFGDSIDAIALTWLVYQLTENAAWSALAYAINRVPTILFTPLAGAYVEGRRKKWIMIWTDLGRAVCVAVIATTYLSGVLQAWMLFVITFTISTLEAFRVPASTALLPKILDQEYYDFGLSLESSINSITGIIGTAMAGGVIALFGVSGAIYIDMATFLLSAGVIVLINSHEGRGERQKIDRKTYIQTFVGGVQYVKESRTFLFFILLCVLLNGLLTPINSMMAPMVSEILSGGAGMLSVVSISCTVGALLGSFSYPYIKRIMSQRVLFALCGFGIGGFYIGVVAGMPLYGHVIVAYVFVTVLTVVLAVFAAWLSNYMTIEFIKKVDETYLARCSGILNSASMASTPVISFLVSAVVGFTGTKEIFVGTGILAVIICGIMMRSPQLNEMPAEVA